MKQIIIQILVYNLFKKNDQLLNYLKLNFFFKKKKEEINQIFVVISLICLNMKVNMHQFNENNKKKNSFKNKSNNNKSIIFAAAATT